jgi:hypothetical protein
MLFRPQCKAQAHAKSTCKIPRNSSCYFDLNARSHPTSFNNRRGASSIAYWRISRSWIVVPHIFLNTRTSPEKPVCLQPREEWKQRGRLPAKDRLGSSENTSKPRRFLFCCLLGPLYICATCLAFGAYCLDLDLDHASRAMFPLLYFFLPTHQPANYWIWTSRHPFAPHSPWCSGRGHIPKLVLLSTRKFAEEILPLQFLSFSSGPRKTISIHPVTITTSNVWGGKLKVVCGFVRT